MGKDLKSWGNFLSISNYYPPCTQDKSLKAINPGESLLHRSQGKEVPAAQDGNRGPQTWKTT